MYITIDTSALIAVIGNEASKQKIIEITKGYSLCAPASVHWEIGNAFSAMFKRQKSSIKLAKKALKEYKKIPIKILKDIHKIRIHKRRQEPVSSKNGIVKPYK